MPGPLHGFRILDLSAVISGPYGTMILADQGADVIKVEPPGTGDFTRSAGNKSGGMSASFLNNNRNKRSIALDLRHPDGVAVVKRLAATCDVIVQNFRPGVADRLGVGEAAIRAVAPTIIYVSISGFGEVGPFSQKPVYDPIVQALSGLASVQGGSDAERPRLVRTILPDKLTAITAAQAITAALLARARTGQGQHVRLSILDAIVAFLWSSDMGGQTYIDKTVSQQRAASIILDLPHGPDRGPAPDTGRAPPAAWLLSERAASRSILPYGSGRIVRIERYGFPLHDTGCRTRRSVAPGKLDHRWKWRQRWPAHRRVAYRQYPDGGGRHSSVAGGEYLHGAASLRRHPGQYAVDWWSDRLKPHRGRPARQHAVPVLAAAFGVGGMIGGDGRLPAAGAGAKFG